MHEVYVSNNWNWRNQGFLGNHRFDYNIVLCSSLTPKNGMCIHIDSKHKATIMALPLVKVVASE